LKVLKFGGSSLKDASGFKNISQIIQNEENPAVIISGVCGVTDSISKSLNSKSIDEIAIAGLISHLKRLHFKISSEAISDIAILKKVQNTIKIKLEKLEKLLRGVYYIEEISDRTRDLILSYGERLSVPILAGTLQNQGYKAMAFEADDLGIITNGDFGNAVAILNPISKRLKKDITPLLQQGIIPIITGFFGCDNYGQTTLFGRNGSDYSASIIASALDADKVEIWKDVDGFLSADPTIIKNTRLIENLTYREAAELSYFGAKILHPRTVEPLQDKSIRLQIKNIYKPQNKGTTIVNNGYRNNNSIKSIAYHDNIACIKIHGPGVGHKPGVLSEVINQISISQINIKSVITSQTCITLIFEKKDLDRSYELILSKDIKTVEKVEKIDDIALIAIVGEGIIKNHGIAAKVFHAVATNGINIEMISAGASDVAYYFIVKENVLEPAINAIHEELNSSCQEIINLAGS